MIELKGFARQSTARKNDEPRERAELWLNIGTVIVAPNKEGVEEEQFLSIAGIPLDTIKDDDESKGSEWFRMMNAGKNDLRRQVVELGMTLNPGEDAILLGEPGGLQLQVRRVRPEAAPVDQARNPFAIKLNIKG